MPDWCRRRSQLSPDKTALITPELSWTFAQLDAAVTRTAGMLHARGVRAGDRVGTLTGNSAAFVAVVHALIRCRAVLVPLNVRLSDSDMAWQLANAGASWLVYDESHQEAADALAKRPEATWAPIPIDAVHAPLRTVAAAPQSLQLDQSVPRIELDAIQGIMYTSGTTGRPKGALLTLGNHWWSATGSALNLGLHDEDRWLAVLPLFHIGGLAILLRSVICGITVLLHQRFDASAANRAIDENRASIVSAVSPILADLVADRGEKPFPPTLRAVLAGGGPIPRPLLDACRRLNAPIIQTYGMTETASQATALSPADGPRKPGSSGKPLFATEILIDAPTGEAGEIFVRGPTVSPGYWSDQDDLGAVQSRDGWFATGDIGRMDDEGFLYVLDRRSDLIISGGENVYPKQVESVLESHPAIQEAGVTGMAHPRWGQVPIAFVVLHSPDTLPAECPPPTEQQLIAFCRERLAGYQTPVRISIVKRLPRNAAGKLLRRNLAQLAPTKSEHKKTPGTGATQNGVT